jgi:hypothetical protein
MTLGWIIAASFAGGTLSAGLAAASLALRATWVPMLMSFAIGALLGAAGRHDRAALDKNSSCVKGLRSN